ncbi:MAG TPA: alpha/beta hydrolase [bacterium]|nr:alpha/beta hydrolase [bacterium]
MYANRPPLFLLLAVVLMLAVRTGGAVAEEAESGRRAPSGPRDGNAGAPGGQAVLLSECEVDGTEHTVDVGGRKLNGFVYGEGSPTIVLVSGFGAPQAYWNRTVPALAEGASVVTYDRAGYGRSEVGDLPLDGGRAAADLHRLLEGMEVAPPYLVVGHSYGASVARLFCSAYPDDIGGLVLVDGQHEDILGEQLRVLEGDDLAALEQAVARMGEMADPGSEMGSQSETREQLRGSAPLPQVPYVVITAGDRSRAMPPIFSDEGKEVLIALGVELQQRLVELIPGGEHVLAEGVGHNIPVDHPEIVTAPVLEMVKAIRPAEGL